MQISPSHPTNLRETAQRRKYVLMVDYFFPPVARAGAHRTVGYVKHLEEFGWIPTVLTVHGAESAFYDASLLDGIPRWVNVQRTPSLEPIRFIKRVLKKQGSTSDAANDGARRFSFWEAALRMRSLERWLLFPDRRIGWLPFAVGRALSLSRRRPIDIIYSTSTVVTSHLIALLVHKLLGKPWVADFQDPWPDKVSTSFPSILHRKAADGIEHLILREADRVTVTTDPMRQSIIQRFPTLPRRKLTTISMGFEPDVFRSISRTPPPKFTITHFGNFYGPRSPRPFLEALGACVREHPGFGQQLEVFFLGSFDPEHRVLTEALLHRFDLLDIVRLVGMVPYHRGVEFLMSSDVLLLVTDPGWWGYNLVPSKLFEYLATGRPILALAPEGATAQIVRETKAGLIVEPANVQAIRRAILDLYTRWTQGTLAFSISHDVVRKFTWKELTRQFASVLEEALCSNLGSAGGVQ